MGIARTVVALAVMALLAGPSAAQTSPTETLVFAPIADTYVDSSSPTVNFNSDARLRADAVPARATYLRFAVSGVNGRAIGQARLRLQVSGPSAVTAGSVHLLGGHDWDEATLTWNSRPAIDGPALATLGPVPLGAIADFDVSGAITGDGVYDLAIDSPSSDAVSFVSSAAASGQKPSLVLTVAAPAAPTVTILNPADGAVFFLGDPVTLQATATEPTDGDLSALVGWTSSLQGDLGAGSLVTTTLAAGIHTLVASVTDSAGATGRASVAVTVRRPPAGDTPPLVAISAPVDGRLFAAGQPVTFAGSASDLEEGVLTGQLVWTSDLDGVLGTGGTFARPLTVGTHRISAVATDTAGLQGGAQVNVTVTAPLTREFTATADAYVDAAAPATNFGTNALLRADANVFRATYLRFAPTGVGTAVVRAILRLQVDGAVGAASDSGGALHAISDTGWQENAITFSTRPAIDGPALGTLGAVAPGQTVEFDVTPVVSGDGTYAFALTNGSSDSADYRSKEGGAPPRLIVTLAGNAPAVAITSPVDRATFAAGDPITLNGTATDLENGNLSASLLWTSSLDGPLGSGPAVVTAALRPGTHVLTAAATDSSGLRGQAQVTVSVQAPNQPPTVTITAPPRGASLPAGTPVTLAATASDAADGDLSAQLTWTSSLEGFLGTGGQLTTILTEGMHTITASVTDGGGLSGAAAVGVAVRPLSTVNAPPLVVIRSPLDGWAFVAGRPVTFTGTAADLEDGTLTGNLQWTSDLDGPLGTGGGFTRVLRAGTHHITATVTDAGGLRGGATVTATVVPPTTLAFTATADTYVDAKSAGRSFGTGAKLLARAAPLQETFLRFAVSGIGTASVEQARLRLTVGSGRADGSVSGGAIEAVDGPWSEATTYRSRPLVVGPVLATAGAVGPNQAVEFDVTSAVRGDGTVNLALVSPSNDSVAYRSREASVGKPQLIVTLGPPRLTLAGTFVDSYQNGTLTTGLRVDARAATFLGSDTNSYPLNLGGGSGVVFAGGAVLGQYDRLESWDAMHTSNNAGIAFSNAQFTVEGMRIDNVTDAIRPQNGGAFTVKGVWLSYIRDNCVEDDHLQDGLVDDSLFDGCYNAFSARPSPTIMTAGSNGATKLWTIQNSLVRLQPMPAPRAASADNLGHDGFFKWHLWGDPVNSLSPKLALYGNVFMAERVGQVGGDRMGIPPGELQGCANNVMVWLGTGPFPSALPPCFTVTTDRSVWDTAVGDWLRRHPDVRR